MKTKLKLIKRVALLALLSTLNLQLSTVFAQGTAFTYQGRLTDGGNPANGSYDLQFTIYDTLTGSLIDSGPLTNSATGITNGLFTVVLDFGMTPFTGGNRFLEIAVRTNGSSTFATLASRQKLTPAPYAITAGNLASVIANNSVNTALYATVGGGDANSADGFGSTVGGGVLELKNSTASPALFGAINFNDSANSYAGQISYNTSDNGLHFRTGGTDDRMKLNAAGLTVNGTFVSASDRNSKENFSRIDSRDLLEKVVSLPVTEWNYKQDIASKHIGPMAQDFYAAFGVGPDDKHIATIDEGGVALAAIQGLNQKLEEARAENTELKQRLEALEKIVLGKKLN